MIKESGLKTDWYKRPIQKLDFEHDRLYQSIQSEDKIDIVGKWNNRTFFLPLDFNKHFNYVRKLLADAIDGICISLKNDISDNLKNFSTSTPVGASSQRCYGKFSSISGSNTRIICSPTTMDQQKRRVQRHRNSRTLKEILFLQYVY
jgi:hypothetical protein